jgi:hypothetical protein
VPLKDKIESVFGGSFNTNGLGGVLTCGVTGIGAGLSHSPICVSANCVLFLHVEILGARRLRPKVYDVTLEDQIRQHAGLLHLHWHAGWQGALRVLRLPPHCHQLGG